MASSLSLFLVSSTCFLFISLCYVSFCRSSPFLPSSSFLIGPSCPAPTPGSRFLGAEDGREDDAALKVVVVVAAAVVVANVVMMFSLVSSSAFSSPLLSSPLFFSLFQFSFLLCNIFVS